ncbi:DUF6457 domain-containing protein [Georgenia sp. Z1491]|uniref:DUF6457 domain-containing protein n=1 Tax=Georgenia sp. Z1491 TaxID=3416707 RepID=UPI003CF1B7D0
MSGTKRLPPEILDEWLVEAADELGLDPDDVDIDVVLDLTRDVAHDVARPAAPLTAFLLGLAAGRSGDPAVVEPLVGRLTERAAAFGRAREQQP